jgi:hypothetical protein
MAPPIMAKEIGESLGLPSPVAGAYIGVLYAGVIVTSSATSPGAPHEQENADAAA